MEYSDKNIENNDLIEFDSSKSEETCTQSKKVLDAAPSDYLLMPSYAKPSFYSSPAGKRYLIKNTK